MITMEAYPRTGTKTSLKQPHFYPFAAFVPSLTVIPLMNKNGTRFEGLLDRYFDRLLKDAPTFAVIAGGLAEGEGKLGRMGLQFHQRRERERQAALRVLEQLSPRELSGGQHLDRLALRAQLLKETEDYRRNRHTLEPNGPEQLFGILLHELQRGDDEPQRAARNLRSLMKQAPDFLDEAATAIRNPERVWLRVMEQTVAGGATLLEAVSKFLHQANPLPSDAGHLRATSKALERYRDNAKRRKPAPHGSFSIGASLLQRRVRDELGLDYTLGEVESLALSEVERIGQALQTAARRFAGKRLASRILADFQASWRPEKPLLELYQSETFRVADAFRQARAVTFPKHDELQVRRVPEFLRTLIPTAAYSQPGAFARRQRGIFWVNDHGQDLKEQQQHFGIPLICAHEAYPGHHLQFVSANRHPRKWRRLFAHAVFYEGWTLWCEHLMIELKIDRTPWLRLQQLHDALWRCHRILVDLRLQTGRYGYEQGVRHLCKHLGFTRGRAEAEINWYTASPAVPMSYWLGRLENARLCRRLIDGRGWSLRKFNDWLLSFGTIPQAWIEKYGLD